MSNVRSPAQEKKYIIRQSDWDKIPKDYKGRSLEDDSVRTVFEGSIPGNNGKGGTTLLFEHKHFEVVPDRIHA